MIWYKEFSKIGAFIDWCFINLEDVMREYEYLYEIMDQWEIMVWRKGNI